MTTRGSLGRRPANAEEFARIVSIQPRDNVRMTAYSMEPDGAGASLAGAFHALQLGYLRMDGRYFGTETPEERLDYMLAQRGDNFAFLMNCILLTPERRNF